LSVILKPQGAQNIFTQRPQSTAYLAKILACIAVKL